MEESKNLIVAGDLTPVLGILKEEDAQTLITLPDELVDTWSKKQLFRTETEMRVGVLDDIRHPTNASKYWQAVREQSGMFENIIQSSFEIRRNKVKREKIFIYSSIYCINLFRKYRFFVPENPMDIPKSIH